MKPRLLDLFCLAGGATKGYQHAGFHVTGVDLIRSPRYCGDVFFQADALEYLERHGREYDVIHASPPCQAYSRTARIHGRYDYPDLIPIVRELLCSSGRQWILENVVGAPMFWTVTLCGTMFGLRVFRHRLFESSLLLLGLPHKQHRGSTASSDRYSCFANATYITVAGNNFSRKDGSVAMGIDWMTRRELSQAIPPAYTKFLGRQLLAALEVSS